MSSANDLRTAIGKAAWDALFAADVWDIPTELKTQIADAVLAVLGNPVHCLALLELVGEVREGWLQRIPGGGGDFVDFKAQTDTPVTVVVPRWGGDR